MKRTRTKRSRIRGRRSCFNGARNNYRGKGMRGGKGMAGTGKRAGQLKLWVLKYAPDYFGKRGFSSKNKKLETMNIGFLNDKIESLVKQNKAKKTDKGYEIELKGYKILSGGKINKKIIVKASEFSKKTEEKISKAGGSAIKL
jgi:large subunit ribosomal protein L15